MADQKTGDAAVSSLVTTYYEKVGLERLLPKLRYYQFADKKALPPRSGKTVQWYRFRVQAAVTSNMTELTVPSQVYLSADTVSATLIQRGAYAKISDMLILTAIDPILEDAAVQMGEKAARTVDTYVRDSLGLFVVDHASRSSVTLARWGTGTMNATGITARLWSVSPDATTGDGFPMLQNNTRVSQSGTVASLTTSALTVKNIQHAAQYLRNRDVDPFDDGLYVGIVHPIAAYDLMIASGWKGWQKYSSPELMYKGEIGQVGGVRFVTTSEAPSFDLSGDTLQTNSGNVYGTFIFGKHAYGVTEIQGGGNKRKGYELHVKQLGSAGTADPVNGEATVGFKITMAAKILNKSAGVWVISNSTSG